MSVSTIIRIYCPKYHINLIYENNKNCRKSILPYPISFEILNIYKIVQFWCYETLVTYQTAERCPWNETGASSSLYGSTDQKRTRMCHFEISKYLWSRNTHCSVCTFFWKFICRYRFTIRRLKLFCLSWSFTAQSALVRSCRLGQFT